MTWYTTGTINVTKGSKIVIGIGTQWANPLMGVSAGRMLILQMSTTIEIYEIESVQSDTQLKLVENYPNETGIGKIYKIPTSPTVSIEQLALEISATLGYYQKQIEGWQSILTGSSEVVLTAPNGQKVTVKPLANLIDGAVIKSGDTMTGQLGIKSDVAGVFYENVAGQKWLSKIFANGDLAVSQFNPDTQVWSNKLRYIDSTKKWHFEDIDDVTINGSSVLKKGDGGLYGVAPQLPDGTDLLSDIVCSNSQLFTLNGKYKNVPSPSSSLIGMLEVKKLDAITDEQRAVLTLVIDGLIYITVAFKGKRGWIFSYDWQLILTQKTLSNYITQAYVGEFRLFPFRANELPKGWYMRNGDNILISLPAARALDQLSSNFKADHGITTKTINGKQYINLPNAFVSGDSEYTNMTPAIYLGV